jgi:cytochrome c biogenesis protein CcmG, thiol:disulfide interchange protein DsbE
MSFDVNRHKAKLLATILLLALGQKAAQAATDIGQPIPPLVVQQLDGKTFDLASLKGRVILVHYWATWCAPCKVEMPVLDSFYRLHRSQGLDMIAISVDKSRYQDDVRAALSPYNFPAAMLDDVTTNGFDKISEIPVTYVIDRRGILRVKLTSAEVTLTEQSLESIVTPLLK